MNKSFSLNCNSNDCNQFGFEKSSSCKSSCNCCNFPISFPIPISSPGPTEPTGPTGPSGGPTGPTGATGAQGESGGLLGYADFYALMLPDNATIVAPGTDVSFLQDGPNSGTGISRISEVHLI